MKKLSYFYFALIALLFPFVSSAHVKWFVETDDIIANSHGVTSFYPITSSEVLIWSGIVVVIVIAFSILDKYLKAPSSLVNFGFNNIKTINRVSQVLLGIFLISITFIWKIVLVPNAPATTPLSIMLLVVQAVIGIMYILNYKPRLASILLAVFYFSLFFSGGIIALLENIMLLCLAIYFFTINTKDDLNINWLRAHSLEIIRIGTGISLITFAFTEKLLYPELSLQFLSVHHWNFMQAIFPLFTDKLFVLSTGFAELIFGLLFVFGYITRVTTILIALFFAASVTTMFIQFGAWETEDLVVYAAAVLFIFFGSGRNKFYHHIWPNSILQKQI